MKIYTYPHENIGFIDLVDQNNQDIALKVVNSARISYDSTSEQFTEKDGKLAKFLWNHEHTSPFRHSFYTFHIKAPLSVFRQWTKYQVGSVWREYEVSEGINNTVSVDVFDLLFDTDKGCSWNEISRRYASPKDEYYLPKKLRTNPPHGNKQTSGEYKNPLGSHDIQYMENPIGAMRSHTEAAFKLYKLLVANGVAREQARNVLPDNIYSQAYWTVSLQAVIHFLGQRTKPDAQFEIRCYAEAIKEAISKDLDSLQITL